MNSQPLTEPKDNSIPINFPMPVSIKIEPNNECEELRKDSVPINCGMPIPGIIKIEPNIEKEINVTVPTIRIRSLSSLQSEPLHLLQSVGIKEEVNKDDSEMLKLIERVNSNNRTASLSKIPDGYETDEFIDNNKMDKTTKGSENLEQSFLKRKRPSRSSSISSNSNTLGSQIKKKDKILYSRSSETSSDNDISTDSKSSKKKSSGKKKAISSSRKRYIKSSSRSRSRDKKKRKNYKSKSRYEENNPSTSNTKDRRSKSKYESERRNVETTVSSKSKTNEQLYIKPITSVVAGTTTETQPNTSTKANMEYQKSVNDEYRTTTVNNLRPIIVKKELTVLPIILNRNVKQELNNEKNSNDINQNQNDEVRIHRPISVKVENEQIRIKNELQSEEKCTAESENNSSDIVQNCLKVLKLIESWEADEAKGHFRYFPSKIVEPLTPNINISPLLRDVKVEFFYSCPDVQYKDFGITTLPPVTTKVANILGFDLSELKNSLNDLENEIPANTLKIESSTLVKPSIKNLSANLMLATSTQTDMIPCIECAHRKLKKQCDFEVQVAPVIKDNCVQTDREIPLIQRIHAATPNQLISLSDYFELLTQQSTGNDIFDRLRLREMLVEIFDKGQAAKQKNNIQPTIIAPTPGISAHLQSNVSQNVPYYQGHPNYGNQYYMQSNTVQPSTQHSQSNMQHPQPNMQHFQSNMQHPQPNVQHSHPNMQHSQPNMQHPHVNIQHPHVNIQHPQSNTQPIMAPQYPIHQDPYQQMYVNPLQNPVVRPSINIEPNRTHNTSNFERPSTLNNLYPENTSNRTALAPKSIRGQPRLGRGRGRGRGDPRQFP